MSLMSEKMASEEQYTGLHQQTINSDKFNSLVSQIMVLCAAPSSKRHELEHLLSNYMKHEGDFASSEQMVLSGKYLNPENQEIVIGTRSLLLQFLNNISQPVFTGVPIKGEDGQPVMVSLIDGQSGEVVAIGPEASSRVEIVVLEADFGGHLGESMTREEFKGKVVKEGDKRLLTGSVFIDLKEGIGCAGTFQFSHTKFWKGKCAYRLGVMVTEDGIGSKIKEGFTDSFLLKDRRLDLNMKHNPPTLLDEVWRLNGIGKDGAFHRCLKKFNIHTVEDVLKKLNTEPQKLRDILGKFMSAKMWEALVTHVRTCIVDERLHLYFSSGSQQKTSVLFNVVGQVIGLYSESEYVTFEMMSKSEKDHAMNLVLTAFQQWDEVLSFSNEASLKEYLEPSLISPITDSSNGNEILIPLNNNELFLPQSAISFDDTASIFEESPGLSNIVYPPKSPFAESSSGSRNNISPKFNEPDFPQPNYLSSFSHGSSNSSNIISPPKFPINQSSGDIQILIAQKNNELCFPPPAFSYDDCSLLSDSPGPSNIISSPKPLFLSQETIPTCDSVWDMTYLNAYNCHSVDDAGYRHETAFSYSSQMTDHDNWDIISMNQPLYEENHDFSLQFPVDDVPLYMQGLNCENEPPATHPDVPLLYNARKKYLRNKAKRKWKVLFSVMRWLFIHRNTAGKLPVGKLQVKLSSSFQDLQALDSVDSGYKQPYTSGGGVVKPIFYEAKGFQFFSSHAPVLSRNLSIKSEANLHGAVNDILLVRSVAFAKNMTQRKYISKREKARRRWTKLYSVMRWFSVQRNVTKRACSLVVRDPSSSSSLNDMSATWAVNSSSCDGYIESLDMCPSQQNYTSSACPFHEDEYMQLFNKLCSLQPRDRIAMNKLARRRNAANRSFAKKKWRMLFTIMKWLSVRRNAARVKATYKNS